jgi:hypothetical protein
MVEHGDLTGVTRNATIFEKAIDRRHDYDQSLSRLIAAKPQLTAYELYERMSSSSTKARVECLQKKYAFAMISQRKFAAALQQRWVPPPITLQSP